MAVCSADRRSHCVCCQGLLLVLAAWLTASGCSGCRQDGAQNTANAVAGEDEDQEESEEEKKKKLPDFEVSPVVPLLSESLVDVENGTPLSLAKPSHWTATAQRIKANADDLEATATLEVLDAKGEPHPLPHTPYQLVASRPAVLAKGQEKRIEADLLAPSAMTKFQVDARLQRATTGYRVGEAPAPSAWRSMPSYQYFLVVLAAEPAQYAYLKVANSVRAPWESSAGRYAQHYRVILADGDQPPPLPANPLEWTSVAYLWWDEPNLARISPEQQQALVDWLHWGGRLVINGPDSLDALRGSFLAPHLPADGGKSRSWTEADLAPLSEAWSHRDRGRALPALKPTKPWSGIELTPRDGGRVVPGSGGLLVERNVGLGSVVVSAMQLAQRDLVNWPGFDGFLNGAVLRRPPRVFRIEQDSFFTGLEVDWFDAADRRLDAYFTTPMRWFARDAGTQANMREELTAADPQAMTWGGGMSPEVSTVVDRPGGLGSWSEFSPVASAARSALREAAGVRVPGAGFVVGCLAIYLVVLVPFNWMVFHALRRIEWAWIAAPIIAILGAAAVVHQAQLDIGFVSSRTEIALLELQGEHDRGHLSRFAGLYTSLSATYDVQYDQPTAVATPFPRDNEFQLGFGDSYDTVAFEKYAETKLRGLAVSSATTQFLHSEEIHPLEDTLRLATFNGMQQLHNGTGHTLTELALVRRQSDGSLLGCWIDELRSGNATVVSFQPLSKSPEAVPFAAERADAARRAAELGRPRLDVEPVVKLALRFPAGDDPIHGSRSETRLVARIDGVLPGAVSAPEVSQAAGVTVVLAHLDYGPLAPPRPDANSPGDVLPAEDQRNAFDEDQGLPAESDAGN